MNGHSPTELCFDTDAVLTKLGKKLPSSARIVETSARKALVGDGYVLNIRAQYIDSKHGLVNRIISLDEKYDFCGDVIFGSSRPLHH